MTPTIKTGTKSVHIDQKLTSLTPSFNFRLSTTTTEKSFAPPMNLNFCGNSLLNDDKLLKSLENVFLAKSKSNAENDRKRENSSIFSTESRLGQFDLESKISRSESTNDNFGMDNKFLTNGLLENRFLNHGLTSKFDTSSKISTVSTKLPTITSSGVSTIAPQFNSFATTTQSTNLDGLMLKNLSPDDVKDRKRKPKDAEVTIIEEIYDLTFVDEDRDGPAPTKRSKCFLENDLKEKKKTFADELQENCKNKLQFVNCIAGSLISGPKFFSVTDETRQEIISLADKLVNVDPEFILKVALYTRCDLNIRTTANFLLAYAADRHQCRRYLKKYFVATIRLPSDWIEVVELYSSLKQNKSNNKPCPLPNALRNVMVEKFAGFDEYQLAKHNKNKKSNKGKKKTAEMAAKKIRRGLGAFTVVSRTDESSSPDLMTFDDDAPTMAQQSKKLNLKKLIRQLHIQKPANFVMGILGKKYPADSLTFQRSGLLGIWEEARSGKRMKLAIPETWETQIATRGNKAEVWQDLLDHKKLPYMALLRNLRNIIKSGVEEKYHKMILQRLENEYAVMNSKQFPFRFFSAYHVLDQLVEDYKKKIEEMSKAGQKSAKLPTRAVKKGKVVEWWVRKRAKKLLQTTIHYDEVLINRYRKALDNAVRIATIRNVKPIRGRTVVYCNVDDIMHTMPCSSAKGLGKPRTIEEIGLLLALMCTYVCEDSRLFLYADDQLEEAHFSRGTILENMSTILEQAEKLRSSRTDTGSSPTGSGDSVAREFLASKPSAEPLFGDKQLSPFTGFRFGLVKSRFGEFSSSVTDDAARTLMAKSTTTQKFLKTLRSYLIDRSKVDNILLISRHPLVAFDGFESVVTNFLTQYRRLVNEQTLYVNINLSANLGISQTSDAASDPRNVYLRGYSDQILRYVAERGSADQLNHVENIDLAYDLMKNVEKPQLPFKIFCDESFLSPTSASDSMPNVVRVFISSTFRDMQSERNLLLRYVFPEIQRRARSKFSIDILPVDLRWGITESQAHSHSSVNLCLQQVSKCQLFIGLLGERYGFRIPDYSRIVDENGLPYDWLNIHYPPSASVTELEIYKFALSNVQEAKNRSFFYLRDPKFMNDVPETFLDLMTEKNDPTAAERLKILKTKILQSGLPVYKDYPWKFDGIRDGLPHLSQLQTLGQRILDDLWSNITSTYENYDIKTSDADDVRTQWTFVKTQSSKFVGREKLMTFASTCFKKQSSGLFLVSSNGAFGKTAFMAALSEMIRDRQEMYGSPIICFRDALIDREHSDHTQILFKYLSVCAGNASSTVDKEVSPMAWSELLKQLTDCGYRLTFLLDGFDNSQIEWLFDGHFENVKFIVSVDEDSSLAQSIVRRKIVHRKIDLPELDFGDRAKLVRNVLSTYGKTLDEKSFNNQMRILLSKRDSSTPAYLLIACEQLRLFGSFENINPTLRCMSSNMTGLICDVLKKIESDHERRLIEIVLCFVVSFDGQLSQTDLYQLTSMALSFSNLDKTDFDAVFKKYDEGFICTNYLPYSTFLFVYNVLAPSFFTFIPNQKGGENLINVKFHEIATIIRKFYVKNKKLYDFLKTIFAGYLWFCCDPSNDGNFGGIVGRHFSLLPSALTNVCQFIQLFTVVTNDKYVEKCFLLRAYVDFQQFFTILLKSYEKSQSIFINPSLINDMQRFIVEKSEFLYKFPALTNQEIKNQPTCSVLYELYAYDNSEKECNPTMKHVIWMNKPRAFSFCDRTSVVENVTSVAVSIDTRFAAVGTKDGRVLLMDCSTGREIHSFVGHCDTVSDVCFLDDHGNTLASCTSGGAIFVWNTKLLTKTASLTGHSGYVSMCRPFKWGKVVNLISVGWDSTIRMWNYLQSKEINTIKDKILNSPINCLDCHPTDQKIVVGLWNSKVVVFSVAPIERKAVLRGHLSSVRAVAYHPNGLFIVSASMDGEVKLWSSLFASQIGSFKGHCGPVTKLTYSNETLITAAEDSLLKVWSPLLGVPICSVEAPVGQLAATAVALSSDGKTFAVGHNSNKVSFYTFNPTSQEVNSNWASTFSTSVQRLKFIQKNLLFIVCRDEARVVSSEDGSVAHVLQNDEGPMTGGDCVGGCLVTSHANGVLCFYKTDDWTTMDAKKRSRRASLIPRAVVHGHTGAVNDCAFNSNGDHLVSVGVDKNLFFWDVVEVLSRKSTTPSAKSLYNCHTDSITCVAWSDRKDILVTGSNDCTLKVWSSETMELLTTFATHKAPITDVTIKRGCIVSSSLDGIVAVWSVKGVLVTQLKDDSGCTPLSVELVLQPKEETTLWAEIVDEDERENAVDESKEDKLTQSFGSINFDEALLLASFTNGTATLWKPLLGHAKASLSSHTSSVIGLSSSASYSTKFFSASNDGACKFWTLPGPNIQSNFGREIHNGAVMCAAACPDEPYICTGGRDGKCALTTYHCNGTTDLDSFSFVAHSNAVTGVVWLSDVSLVTSGEDGFVKFWIVDIADQRATFVKELKLDHPTCALAYDGNMLCVALWSGHVMEIIQKVDGSVDAKEGLDLSCGIWIESLKINSSQLILSTSTRSAGDKFGIEDDGKSFILVPNTSFATNIGRNNRYIVGCTDNGLLFIYDRTSPGTIVRQWQAHSGRITCALVFISSFKTDNIDEAIFCTVSHDRTLKIWKGSELIGLWESPTALTFVEFNATRKHLWCGDMLGCIYCLYLD